MRETSNNKCRKVASMALSIWLLAGSTAFAATIDSDVSLPGIPQAGDPSFSFGDPVDQGGGSYSSTIQSWYTNYLYIAPSDTGYDVYAYNSGSFEFEQTAGEVYSGENGSLALNAQLDQAGNVISGEYQLTGEISGLGITEAEILTSGNIVDVATEDATIGFATDNISCAPEIKNCLDAESIYVFAEMSVPELSELDGTSGFMSTTASLTTVPLPGSAWLFLTSLALLVRKARANR
jgi:hypothetical protein